MFHLVVTLFFIFKGSISLQCYNAAYPNPAELPKKWDITSCATNQCFKLKRIENVKTVSGVIFACDLIGKCSNSLNMTVKTDDGLSLTCCGSDLCNTNTIRPFFFFFLPFVLSTHQLY